MKTIFHFSNKLSIDINRHTGASTQHICGVPAIYGVHKADVRCPQMQNIHNMGRAVARHGLILSQNEAASLRKVSKYLPGVRDTVLRPTITAKVKQSAESKKNIIHCFPPIFLYVDLAVQ